MTADRHIPEATVARLPVYLRCLVEVAEAKMATISSERLAELAGVNAAKLRKDLSYLGSYGTRGVGYDVEFLMYQIGRQLGLTQDWPIVIIGIGITAGYEVLAVSTGKWRYAETMPTLFGIGVLPLLQWLLLPIIEVMLFQLIATRFARASNGQLRR